MIRTKILDAALLALAAVAPGQAPAETIVLDRPIAGAALHSGGVDLVVYYVDRGDHFEVVGTYLARDPGAAPARLRMALADGDGARFGLPGMATKTFYDFSRRGSTVRVEAMPVGEAYATLE